MAETGFDRKMGAETNCTFGTITEAAGEAECAAIQTVQAAESVEFACRCVTNSIADKNASNTHRHAIHFDIDRMTATPWKLHLNLYKIRNERNDILPSRVYIRHFYKCKASQQFEIVGTADARLILFGRTTDLFRLVQLIGVLSFLAANASGDDSSNPSKNPPRRRRLPTE